MLETMAFVTTAEELAEELFADMLEVLLVVVVLIVLSTAASLAKATSGRVGALSAIALGTLVEALTAAEEFRDER